MKTFSSLAVDISNKCNLNCNYCFESVKYENEVIDVKKIYDGIDFFFNNLIDEKPRFYHFHFGRREPLLNFKLFKNIVEILDKKTRKLGKLPKFHITTNGTIYNEEIVRIFKKYDFDIRVSFDGSEKAHNKNRLLSNRDGSFSYVEKTIELLEKNKIPFTINSVITPENSIIEILNYFDKIKVQRVDFMPLWVFDKNNTGTIDFKKIKQELKLYTQNLISQIYNNETNFTRIVNIEKYLLNIFGFKISTFYCGASRDYIGISIKGDFYPCLKFINKQQWKLGLSTAEINKEKTLAFQRQIAIPVNESIKCKMCEIANYCKGMCYFDMIDISQSQKSFNFYCFFQKEMFSIAQQLYDEFKVSTPELLMKYTGIDNYLK